MDIDMYKDFDKIILKNPSSLTTASIVKQQNRKRGGHFNDSKYSLPAILKQSSIVSNKSRSKGAANTQQSRHYDS
jgi:hypothetical protein